MRLKVTEPNTFYSLGQAHLARGETADALRYLEQAVQQMPGDAHSRNLLGVALARAGDVARAQREIEKAWELAPGNAVFKANLTCLRNGLEGCLLKP